MRSAAGATVLALFLAPVPAAAKGLLVSPSHLFVDAGAGGEATLVLKPTTAEPTRVVLGVRTFLLDENGRPLLGAVDAGSRTGGHRTRADLVTVAPAVVLLEGGPVTVTVRLHAPPEVGSVWAAIVLDVEPVETSSGNGAPVLVVTRVIVPVVVTRGDSEPSLSLANVRARPEKGGIEVTALVRNEGRSVVRTFAEVIVEDSAAGSRTEIAQGRVPDLVLLPGLSRLVRAHLAVGPSVAAGLVRVVVPAAGRFFEAEVRPEAPSAADQGAGSSAEPATKTESPD